MKNKNSRLFTSWIVLVVIAACFGCGDKEDAKNTTTWCILVDMSGVRKNMETRRHYADHLKTVFSKLAPGDVVTAALITELSVTEPKLLLRHIFNTFIPTTDNEIYVKAEKLKFQADFEKIKDSLIKIASDTILHSDRITSQTDIITACHVAASLFKQYPAVYRKLIILSDMEENDGTYNFISDKLTEQRISQIIKAEKKSSRGIPDLGGVNVYVAGAYSRQSDRFFNIRNFWKQYFKAGGATLLDEHYGGTLTGL